MMPVRSEDRSKRVELRMLELGDEHGRHAVERRCSARPRTASSTASGSKPSDGIDHRRAVGQAGEIAHHHAEAVVERHRDAEAVARLQPHALADEEAVVEDVAVGQRRALGQAGGAAGELDVDRVVGLQRCADLVQRARGPPAGQVRRRRRSRASRAARRRRSGSRRCRCGRRAAVERARRAGGDLGRQGLDHADIVAGLEALGADQRLHADLVQRVFELGRR